MISYPRSTLRSVRRKLSIRSFRWTTGTERSVLGAPGLNVGCVPDRASQQPRKRFGEVGASCVSARRPFIDPEQLGDFGKSSETRRPHPAQA